MAITLSKTNIATGNIITAAEVSQSVDAFTGAVAYDITLSGSLQLTGSVKSRNGYTGSLQGTASVAITASSAISSSRAISSSYALTSTTAFTATSADSVSNQNYDAGTGIQTGTFKIIAGKITLSGGVGSSSAFPQLISKTIGTNAFVTATYADGFVFASPTEPANLMVSVTPAGEVAVIQQATATDSGAVIFNGIYI
jgi:hypothetical protein